jgi:AraC family transcriptional activator of pobA
MAAERNTIPVHKLVESTDQGFQIERIHPQSHAKHEGFLMDAHRDDHYVFLLQETGLSRGMIDFHSFTLKENSLLLILPGQVHSYLEAGKDTSGWFVAMDAGLIVDPFRSVLEDPLLSRKPVSVLGPVGLQLAQLLQLTHTLHEQPAVVGDGAGRSSGAVKETGCLSAIYCKQAIYSLLTSFVAIVTGLYDQRRNTEVEKSPRSQIITQEFRKLLVREYKQWKSPGEYAAALHLSAPYLNEAVKEATGFTVSHWIQQEIMLEAKRLLYHSACTVKEIAYGLGYEDHAYFSRLFKKTVGKTPGGFREQYLK